MVCKRILIVYLAVYFIQAEEVNVMKAMEKFEDYDLAHHNSTEPELQPKPDSSPELSFSTESTPISASYDNSTYSAPISPNQTESSPVPEPILTPSVIESKLQQKPEIHQLRQKLQHSKQATSDKYQEVNYVEHLTPVAVEALSGELALNRPALKINGRVYESPRVMEDHSKMPVTPIPEINNSLELWLDSDSALQQIKLLSAETVPQEDEITILKKSIELLTQQLAELTEDSQISNFLPVVDEDIFMLQIDKQLEEIRKLQLDLKLLPDLELYH